jgi:hypothetical protein
MRPPRKTDGVAVIATKDGGQRLARVPLCSCGTRECGNIGIQFAGYGCRAASSPLVTLLRELSCSRSQLEAVIRARGPMSKASQLRATGIFRCAGAVPRFN